MHAHLRIARPVSDLERSRTLYCQGLGLQLLGRFENHLGFDGVMLGLPGADHHFEFTHCRAHPVPASPTAEDLAVFYIPDPAEWERACARMLTAGFKPVPSLNPYWELHGRSYQDPDGYHVVLQNAEWRNIAEAS